MPIVKVNQVGQGLKRIKRNTNRQDDMHNWDVCLETCKLEQCRRTFSKEVKVFVKPQETEIESDAE